MFPFYVLKKGKQGGFPSSPEVKISPYSVRGRGPHSIPGQETRIPHALWPNKFQCQIPWIEEPSGLQSLGSQRVGHE